MALLTDMLTPFLHETASHYIFAHRIQLLKEEYLLNDNLIAISRVLFEKIQKKAYIIFRKGWDSGVGIVLNSSRNSKYEKKLIINLTKRSTVLHFATLGLAEDRLANLTLEQGI